MTPERRLEIFSKEVLTLSDIAELHDVCNTIASKIMRSIRMRSDRLGVSGIIHIQDYIDALKLDINRYLMPKKERAYEVDYDDSTR